MCDSLLVKTEDELREFYHFLIIRAQEVESGGCADIGRTYREYAKSLVEELGRVKTAHH